MGTYYERRAYYYKYLAWRYLDVSFHTKYFNAFLIRKFLHSLQELVYSLPILNTKEHQRNFVH